MLNGRNRRLAVWSLLCLAGCAGGAGDSGRSILRVAYDREIDVLNRITEGI